MKPVRDPVYERQLISPFDRKHSSVNYIKEEDNKQTKPCANNPWKNEYPVLPNRGKVMHKQPVYYDKYSEWESTTHNALVRKANTTGQQFTGRQDIAKQHQFIRNMASLELFPDEIEKERLPRSSDMSLEGIDNWDLLEKAIQSTVDSRREHKRMEGRNTNNAPLSRNCV